MIIYSHRGIDLDRPTTLGENSLNAFRAAGESGYGIELDVQMTRDQILLVAHDATVEKWSQGKGQRRWNSLSLAEIIKLEAMFGPVARLSQVLSLAEEFRDLQLAIHLKGNVQTDPFLQIFVAEMKAHSHLHERILLFDLKKEAALALRGTLPGIGLAASVADAYDIQRFQKMAHGTLMTVEELAGLKTLFNWAWMDEWDRLGPQEPAKTLYAPESVERLRKKGFKIAMISPELHKAEGHQDAASETALKRRWQELSNMRPDAICTDYPARFLGSSKTA
jgi:glycerophosphoryl diester phosphodiesterase